MAAASRGDLVGSTGVLHSLLERLWRSRKLPWSIRIGARCHPDRCPSCQLRRRVAGGVHPVESNLAQTRNSVRLRTQPLGRQTRHDTSKQSARRLGPRRQTASAPCRLASSRFSQPASCLRSRKQYQLRCCQSPLPQPSDGLAPCGAAIQGAERQVAQPRLRGLVQLAGLILERGITRHRRSLHRPARRRITPLVRGRPSLPNDTRQGNGEDGRRDVVDADSADIRQAT